MQRFLLIAFIVGFCSATDWELVDNQRCSTNCTSSFTCFKLVGYVGPFICLKKGYILNRAEMWPDWPETGVGKNSVHKNEDHRYREDRRSNPNADVLIDREINGQMLF
ncbi:hypothetical protein niasHT_001279 [Heterodera trifolii]|uniref:Uncharacterized protein n=1 Tax=Heterodera trifolii TaxID=157864 RepID=A0ABD2M910_9BILA